MSAYIVVRSGPDAATREEDDATLEAWVVPPGATLPDAYRPREVEEEDVEETAEENPRGF